MLHTSNYSQYLRWDLMDDYEFSDTSLLNDSTRLSQVRQLIQILYFIGAGYKILLSGRLKTTLFGLLEVNL